MIAEIQPTSAEATVATSPSTGTRTTRMLGSAILVGFVLLLYLAFVATDPDIRIDENSGDEIGQFDAVRLLYIHVPASLIAYTAFAVTAIGSIMVLVKRSVWWDLVASSSAEIGSLCALISLVTGAIWGRPIWNTWWEWGDVRVLTTTVLFMLSLGYLAVRKLEGTADQRSRRSAVVGILLAINAVIVNRSVEWWASETLHQNSTIADAAIEDLTLFTFVFSMVLGLAAYVWMLIHRFRLAWLERQYDRFGIDDAIAARRREADAESIGGAR